MLVVTCKLSLSLAFLELGTVGHLVPTQVDRTGPLGLLPFPQSSRALFLPCQDSLPAFSAHLPVAVGAGLGDSCKPIMHAHG